jgi:hypothetical protein
MPITEVLSRIEGAPPAKRPPEIIVKTNRGTYRLVSLRALPDAHTRGKVRLSEVESQSSVPLVSRRRRMTRKTHLLSLAAEDLKRHLSLGARELRGLVLVSRQTGIVF